MIFKGNYNLVLMNKEEKLKRLGGRIKKLRMDKGITQVDLAARVNKDQQSIQRLEAGRINPSYMYLTEIAEGLEISVARIVEFP